MAARDCFKVSEVAAAVEAADGNLARAAQMLGCHRNTVIRYMERPAVREKAEAGREVRLDLAESELDKAVKSGQLGAIIFTLETLGKGRGYTKRVEIQDVAKDVINRIKGNADALGLTAEQKVALFNVGG